MYSDKGPFKTCKDCKTPTTCKLNGSCMKKAAKTAKKRKT